VGWGWWWWVVVRRWPHPASHQQARAVGRRVVRQTHGDAVLGQLVGVGRAHDHVALDLGVSDLEETEHGDIKAVTGGQGWDGGRVNGATKPEPGTRTHLADDVSV